MIRSWRILSIVCVFGLLITASIAVGGARNGLPSFASDADLAKKYENFRREMTPLHQRMDADFNQQDRVVGGNHWHFVDEGPKNGPVVLFLHGLPECWLSWRDVLPKIDPSFRVIAVDMKGYGRSNPTDGNFEWHKVAADTVGLLNSLGVERFYVVGHDWGALIGSVLVGDHAERVLGFVRMEANLTRPAAQDQWKSYLRQPQWQLFKDFKIAKWVLRDSEWWIDMVYSKQRALRGLTPDERDYMVYEFSRPGVAENIASYFAEKNRDLDAALTRVCENHFPFSVLELQADQDGSQNKLFDNIESRCPNVRLKWIVGASHFDNFDQPGQIADAINHYLHENP